MRTGDCYRRRFRGGYVLLLSLLIVIALGAAIYYLQTTPKVSKEARELQEKTPEKYPWVEADRLVAQGQQIPVPNSEQILLGKPFAMKTVVYEGRMPRGELNLLLSPDGRLKGMWSGQYDTISPKISYDVLSGKFEGNIDPDKVLSNESGEETSKLFMIGTGKCMLLESNFDNGKTRTVSAELWVNGWIEPLGSVSGLVVITSDREEVQHFEWKGKLQEPSSQLWQIQ